MDINTVAKFTWGFSCEFFLESAVGNFVWKCPDYIGGDNTITPYDGEYEDWCAENNIPYGRDKGTHTVGGYCGNDVKILNKKG